MRNLRFSRTAGIWLIIASIGGVAIGAKEAFLPTPFGTMENVLMQLLVLVVNTLTLVGVLGLARSGAAGDGALARVGLAIAVVASALFLPFELLVIVNLELGGMLLGLSALGQGVGMLLAGIAVLRAGRWHGWHRVAPLLCGLYTFVVLLPALVVSPEGYNAWALVGWQVTYALLGLALYHAAAEPATVPAAAGA